MAIPVIDLFAGPGGLGEGFSSLMDVQGERTFKIKLSIEMEPMAHRTLELRAFFREFPVGEVTPDYYTYLAGRIGREELFEQHQEEARKARKEAWLATLGEVSDDEVDKRIASALGSYKKNWILIGGPPCQAYSLVGRSRRMNDPTFESDEKHFLYKEYLRILAVHQPPVFVMENVKGLLSAKVKMEGIFGQIRADLEHPIFATGSGTKEDLQYKLYPLVPGTGEITGDFEPEDFVIRAEDFQIPQARHRIILVGVRSDLSIQPEFLKPGKSKVAIEQVIGDLPKLRSGLSKEPDSAEKWRNAVLELMDARLISRNEVTDEFYEALLIASKQISASLTRGAKYLERKAKPAFHAKWYADSELKGVCNHDTRSHIRADLWRYFFSAVYADKFGRSPLLENFPSALLPKHENVQEALEKTKFNDRFRVQVKGRPSTTVVSHISKDGHYYIHYDSSQCRSLTVREAARLQTFPDNYFFEGERTAQYRQVGNAVSPFLANQIAKIVAGMFRQLES